MAAGSVLFDHLGRDAVQVGPLCTERVAIPAASPNRGTAVLTVSDGQAQFSFTNDSGEVVDGGTRSVGKVGSAAVRIWLAGAPASPRYVDNVSVLASTVVAGGSLAPSGK